MPGEGTYSKPEWYHSGPSEKDLRFDARVQQLMQGGLSQQEAVTQALKEQLQQQRLPVASEQEFPQVQRLPESSQELPLVQRLPESSEAVAQAQRETQQQGQGNGQRSAIMQALATAAQRPSVEVPVAQPPNPKLRILQALSSVGSGLLGARDQAKSDKRNRSSAAQANVINALTKGGAGARGTQEQASPGLLTQLAAVPGQVAGAGLQMQADEQAAEQSNFANQAEMRGLDLKAQDSESERVRAEASLVRANRATNTKAPNELFTQQGIDYFNQGLSRQAATDALRSDPDLGPMLAERPDLLGRMLKGHEAGRTGTAKAAMDDARSSRADAAALRAQGRFTIDGEKELVAGYKDALKAVTSQAGSADPVILSPAQFYKDSGINFGEDFGNVGVAQSRGAYIGAMGAWFKSRQAFMKEERLQEKTKWDQGFKEAKQDFAAQGRSEATGRFLWKSVLNLPGVKSFSGTGGIGPSFTKLKAAYDDFRANPDASRAAYQATIVNLFQRLIDPATVREGDIRLYQAAMGTFDRFETALLAVGEGGFVDDDLLNGMMKAANTIHKVHRRFVEGEVDSALKVWNSFGGGDAISDELRKGISDSILSGTNPTAQDVDDSESAIDRATRLRGE